MEIHWTFIGKILWRGCCLPRGQLKNIRCGISRPPSLLMMSLNLAWHGKVTFLFLHILVIRCCHLSTLALAIFKADKLFKDPCGRLLIIRPEIQGFLLILANIQCTSYRWFIFLLRIWSETAGSGRCWQLSYSC